MSTQHDAQDSEHEQKINELTRAAQLAEAEKKKLQAEKDKLEAEKGKLEAQKALEKSATDIDDAKAAKARADAQRERIEAERSLERARRPPDDSVEKAEAARKQADARKALAEAQKSEADASKAKSEAESAALKARFGDVPDSPYKGEVTLEDNAGKAEGLLLAAHAVRSAAAAIVEKIEKSVENRRVAVIATTDVPTFDNLTRFEVEIGIVEEAFRGAHSKSEQAAEAAEKTSQKLEKAAAKVDQPEKAPQKPKAEVAAVPLPGAVGLALQAADRLLGFFRTDYTVGGVDVTVEDVMLINDLAGRLAEKSTVYLPKLFSATALEQARKKTIESLRDLALRRAQSASTASELDESAAEWTRRAEEAKDGNAKGEMTAVAKAYEEAAKELRSAIELYDHWFESLLNPDEKTGAVPIASVVREKALMTALRGEQLLLAAKLHGAGGSFYTKRNIWTVFGAMPFFHMGGTVATYALLEGATGEVKAAGTVPVHGGFFKSTRLANEIARQPGPPEHKPSWWHRFRNWRRGKQPETSSEKDSVSRAVT